MWLAKKKGRICIQKSNRMEEKNTCCQTQLNYWESIADPKNLGLRLVVVDVICIQKSH